MKSRLPAQPILARRKPPSARRAGSEVRDTTIKAATIEAATAKGAGVAGVVVAAAAVDGATKARPMPLVGRPARHRLRPVC